MRAWASPAELAQSQCQIITPKIARGSPKHPPRTSPTPLQPASTHAQQLWEDHKNQGEHRLRLAPLLPPQLLAARLRVPGGNSILASRTAKSAPTVRRVPRPVLASVLGSPRELDG